MRGTLGGGGGGRFLYSLITGDLGTLLWMIDVDENYLIFICERVTITITITANCPKEFTGWLLLCLYEVYIACYRCKRYDEKTRRISHLNVVSLFGAGGRKAFLLLRFFQADCVFFHLLYHNFFSSSPLLFCCNNCRVPLGSSWRWARAGNFKNAIRSRVLQIL
jgi:hypothetical protein